MKRYGFRVKRVVSYIEDLEVLVATSGSVENAARIANEFASGGPINYPNVERYNVTDRAATEMEVVNVEFVGK